MAVAALILYICVPPYIVNNPDQTNKCIPEMELFVGREKHCFGDSN